MIITDQPGRYPEAIEKLTACLRLRVKDPKISVKFYEDNFGMKVISKCVSFHLKHQTFVGISNSVQT